MQQCDWCGETGAPFITYASETVCQRNCSPYAFASMARPQYRAANRAKAFRRAKLLAERAYRAIVAPAIRSEGSNHA